MRNCLLITVLLLQAYLLPAQQPARNTYALVIGIADYGNGVPDLQYANRDASAFAAFLQSASGGVVPAEHIRLLEDSAATTAAVYNGLDWLIQTSKTDDLVYIYFSGHGDIENITVHNNGFLLCHNTPPYNYTLTALSVLHLNDIANTLSAKNKANVVVITDACHSGKMLSGGQNRGPFLSGLMGRETVKRETRIISCAPDELSQESINWGGGRGIFSYYLVKGLTGLADAGGDGRVTTEEIKTYLSSSFARDVVLKNENLKQTPVISGPQEFVLSNTDEKAVQQIKEKDAANPPPPVTMAPPVIMEEEITASPQEYFFQLLKKQNLEKITDSLSLYEQPVNKVSFLMIVKIKELFITQTKEQTINDLRPETDSLRYRQINPWSEEAITSFINKKTDKRISAGLAKINELEKLLQEDPLLLKRFNSELAVAFDDRGQQVIDQYLAGDEAELERRRYYNINSRGYDIYPKMFSLAMKLAPGNEYLYKMLEVKKYYFSGVAARLKIPLTPPAQQKQLAATAMAAQKKALSLDEHAACVYNELGMLYSAKRAYRQAEQYFLEAARTSPGWAIPQANLAGVYAITKKLKEGLAAGKMADSLQRGLQVTTINTGLVYEQTGNLLFAEEYYREAININQRHYYPFDRLGLLYNHTTQFALADSFYYEGELRKKGFHFEHSEPILVFPPPVDPQMPLFLCNLDTASIRPNDMMGLFCWGVQEYYKGKYHNAQRILKKVVALDNEHPLVYHYLGKIFYDQRQWEEAEIMFRHAIRFYRDRAAFTRYFDAAPKEFGYDHACFEKFFNQSYYEQDEDFAFTGNMYEAWEHYEEALAAYRKITDLSPLGTAGYIKLCRLLEKLGRYAEAEEALKSMNSFKKIPLGASTAYGVSPAARTDMELNTFYRRRIEQFPNDAGWNQKLAFLMYRHAARPASRKYLDSIIYFPLPGKEIHVDEHLYPQINATPETSLADKNVTGNPDNFILYPITFFSGKEKLPGTNELFILSSFINTPRKDAITFLSKLAELSEDSATLADAWYKIADVYVWAGSIKQALPYYGKSLEMAPGNANTRLHIANLGREAFQNRMALEQMGYLYNQQQINFSTRLLLAEAYIYAGQFDKGKKVLTEAIQIHPYHLPATDELKGTLEMLSGKPKQALPFYRKLWETNPKDSIALYNMARAYAKTGSKDAAWKWLKAALENGFNYSFVLKYDPALAALRNSPRWDALLKPFRFKEYKAAN